MIQSSLEPACIGTGGFHSSSSQRIALLHEFHGRLDPSHPTFTELLVGAAADNHPQVVAYAIGLGVDLNRLNRNSESALGAAMENAGDFGKNGFTTRRHRRYRYDWKRQLGPHPDPEKAENPSLLAGTAWLNNTREICQMLIAASATDYSPLVIAARDGDLESVRRMIGDGWPVHFSIEAVGTPLVMAIRNRHRKIVEFLLSAGVDPNQPARTDHYSTASHLDYPLMAALEEPGDEKILEMLIAAGAHVDVRCDDLFETPAVLRQQIPSCYAAELLLGAPGQNAVLAGLTDLTGNNAFHIFDSRSCRILARWAKPEDVNRLNTEGRTPLFESVCGGCYDNNEARSETLLMAGADPDRLCLDDPLARIGRTYPGSIGIVEDKARLISPALFIRLQVAKDGFHTSIPLLAGSESGPPKIGYEIDFSVATSSDILARIRRTISDNIEAIRASFKADFLLCKLPTPDFVEPLDPREKLAFVLVLLMNPERIMEFAPFASEIKCPPTMKKNQNHP